MGPGWEKRISILLFLLGGTCLFASTNLPFSTEKSWFQSVHLIEIAILIVLAILLLGLYWSHRTSRHQIPCPTCQYPLIENWRYCPRCGKEIKNGISF